ncbi:hypothetical protein IQ235_10695 [Oscillatoriales cyanobacterium LEGE 11467]|uniref:Uncharacterized protein n=1 Tax=Zarconia navalis LEGE 11467 TaxID=1828826 RepID=A0A928VVZ1_9CYAN|nr:hypothetical protein [Zarconia navalis]MBE9041247.1 hypothetical protein [Zarconia navalis LEGE 11467]
MSEIHHRAGVEVLSLGDWITLMRSRLSQTDFGVVSIDPLKAINLP